MSEFDRKRPFSTCDGDSRAAFYQNGCYFDHAGKPLTPAQAAKPAPGGTFESQVEREVKKRTEPTEAQLNQTVELHDPTNPQNQQKPKPSFLASLLGRGPEAPTGEPVASTSKPDPNVPEPPPPNPPGSLGAALTDAERTANPEPPKKPEPVEPPKDEPEPDPRLKQLRAMTITELNQVVKKAGGTVFRGRLAKAKAITWLLENTAA